MNVPFYQPYVPNYELLTFPEGDFDGPVVDPPGYTVYNLFTNRRFFGSDTTTITRPNGSLVAVVVWGSIWQLECRKIRFTNMPTMLAQDFLVHKSLGSRKRWFQTGDGRFLYWIGPECFDGANGALVATCGRQPPLTGVPTLSVHWAYCGPAVLDFVIITALLMKKRSGESIESRWSRKLRRPWYRWGY